MATVISNRTVSEEIATKVASANASSLLPDSERFIAGMTLHITGYDIVQTEFDGKVRDNSPLRLVFHTTEGLDIPLTMLFKSSYDSDGNAVKPSGTFVEKVTELISGKTVKEFAKAVIKLAKDGITIIRKPYRTIGNYGEYTTTKIGFNLKA